MDCADGSDEKASRCNAATTGKFFPRILKTYIVLRVQQIRILLNIYRKIHILKKDLALISPNTIHVNNPVLQ